MKMSSDALYKASRFNFSVDLESRSVLQIHFLDLVDRVHDLKNPKNLARSLYRYEKFWLPLAAEHPYEWLSAPVDIEWIWHCHMLSPRAYFNDCTLVVNTVVNHELKELDKYSKDLKRSQSLWNQRYGETEEPFYVEFDSPFDEKLLSQFSSKITYDIIEAAMRQKDFVYQVSLPHYRDRKFLQGAMERYKKFIYMKQQLPGEFIVPCYDIDLIWHTHQLHPLEYQADTVKYLGNLFNHDDTVNDRSEGSKLYNADMKTREHWKNIFNERFANFGAMYRGKPPAGVLYELSTEDINQYSTKMTNVTLEEMALHLQSQKRLTRFKLFIRIRTKEGTTSMTLKRPLGSAAGHSDIFWSKPELEKIGTFIFDTKYSNNLEFMLEETVAKPFLCCSSPIKLGENVYQFRPVVEKSHKDGHIFRSRIDLSSAIELSIAGRFTNPEHGAILLSLEQGVYETATIPENIQALWGPVALERLPAGKDNHCKVATHSLKLKSGKTAFTCRTIHSVPLLMSVIQVFYQDKLAAIAHLIASDQLPLPTQVYTNKFGHRKILSIGTDRFEQTVQTKIRLLLKGAV